MASKGTVVVIGSGAAGRSCARSLSSSGWDVTIVESGRVGGTCLWRGCIPKKALYHAARVRRSTQAAEQFGTSCPAADSDWQTVLAWKWHSQETYAGDQKALLAEKGIRLVEGRARFTAPDALDVDGRRLGFDHAVIATGAAPVMPPIPGIESADTSEDALHFQRVPESMAIIGGGFIAMEFAGIYASFGTRVTVLFRGERVLDMLDKDLSDAAEQSLGAVGVQFVRASTSSLVGRDGHVEIHYETPGGSATLKASRVLAATGRRPALEGLGLDDAGVRVSEHDGLVLDQYQRTTNPVVWAIGDAAGGQMHTPVAAAEGRAVASSIDTAVGCIPDCSSTPIACFTVPELATVGLDESSAASQGIGVRTHRFDFDELGAAVIADERHGFIKLLVDESGRIVGGQVAASRASDLIYTVALAVRGRMTLDQLRESPGVHPSFAESLFNAAW